MLFTIRCPDPDAEYGSVMRCIDPMKVINNVFVSDCDAYIEIEVNGLLAEILTAQAREEKVNVFKFIRALIEEESVRRGMLVSLCAASNW